MTDTTKKVLVVGGIAIVAYIGYKAWKVSVRQVAYQVAYQVQATRNAYEMSQLSNSEVATESVAVRA